MSQAHPTDEQLSAALDGQDDGAAAHAADCSSCQARQDELREVIALVGAPVTGVDPAVRDAAVAAAVRSGVGDDFMSRGEIGVADRRRVNWAPIAAVAAVFVVALLAVPRLVSSDSKGDEANSLATGAAERAADETASAVDGGDLGDVPDGLALRDRVGPALGIRPTVHDNADTEVGATGAGSQPAPAAGLAARETADGGSSPAKCSGTARKEYGTGLGPLRYTATARWNGTPAVVLGYWTADAGERLTTRILVLADEDCRLLSAVSL